jgi:hypothetical protein
MPHGEMLLNPVQARLARRPGHPAIHWVKEKPLLSNMDPWYDAPNREADILIPRFLYSEIRANRWV